MAQCSVFAMWVICSEPVGGSAIGYDCVSWIVKCQATGKTQTSGWQRCDVIVVMLVSLWLTLSSPLSLFFTPITPPSPGIILMVTTCDFNVVGFLGCRGK